MNNLQYRYSPATGRRKRVKRMMLFLLTFETNGKRIKRIPETMVKGAWGTQSFNIPDIMLEKEPTSWMVRGSMIG